MKKVALITGASSGLGKEMAYIHASRGADLIIVARSLDKLQQLKSDLETTYKIQVMVLAKDLSLPNSPLEVYQEISEAGIAVDYLINNAGFGGHGFFFEREWESDLAMINLNIIALTALTRFFLPDMIKRNKGRILNVSSTASLLPGPLQAVYFASKAFVTSFSNSIAEEISHTKVTITALLPGATETEFARTSGMENTKLFSKLHSAKLVAKEGYQAMLDGKLEIVCGVSIMQRLLLNLLPLLPKKIKMKQVRKLQEIKR
jgi:short-subunit dehydrogenase